MSEDMSEDLLDYSAMMEHATRSVVRNALTIAAEGGLPGLHHFYITFRTNAAGVAISDQLFTQYPDEITIVLENEFWDLEVADDHFAVSLSFSRVEQRLVVPFDAVVSFVDPSVKFGLQFGAAARPQTPAETPEPETPETPERTDQAGPDSGGDGSGQVIALDSFRKNKK